MNQTGLWCIAQAGNALHNYLRTNESSVYFPPGYVDREDGADNSTDGSWKEITHVD